MLSEMEQMFHEIGATITDLTHWEISQDFEDWMKRAGTGEKETEIIKRLMKESMKGDNTGLRVNLEDGKLGFTYDTVILVAEISRRN
jgi:hypothetical protein